MPNGNPISKESNVKGVKEKIVGSNGARKSTLLRTISGLIRPFCGEIFYDGSSISRLVPGEIVTEGVAQVREGRRLFEGMTVQENLILTAYCRSDKKGMREQLIFFLDLFPRLEERNKQIAAALRGRKQQMCAIGRGMPRPKLPLIVF